MIVNSNRPHAYKQYMTTEHLVKPSKRTVVLVLFSEELVTVLITAYSLPLLEEVQEALLHHCPHRVYEKSLQLMSSFFIKMIGNLILVVGSIGIDTVTLLISWTNSELL